MIHLHRAVVLLLTGRAEAVETSDRTLDSPSLSVKAPTVVRLLTASGRPGR